MTQSANKITIAEVAKLLDKSDRQIRRYVKERRLKADSVRVDGHVKLLFHRGEVEAFKSGLAPERPVEEETDIVDAEFVGEDSDGEDTGHPDGTDVIPDIDGGVKYVVDALCEQLGALRTENRELHYQLEQRSGQVGFLQAKIETLQEEVKALAPAPKEEEARALPWYKRMFSKQPAG